MEGIRRGNKLEVNELREGANGLKEAKEVKENKEEHDKEEARQGNRNKEEAGRTGRTASEEQEQKELLRLVPIKEDEEPEKLQLEIKESKKKKKKKKTADKTKDEIKLALVSVYALAGATLDEVFFLKPKEADLLTEAIYRYLEEHNLLETISEKSATLNLIIALVSVNVPKFIGYYENLKTKKERKEDDKKGQAANDSGQSANGSAAGQFDDSNAKTYLDKFYSTDDR